MNKKGNNHFLELAYKYELNITPFSGICNNIVMIKSTSKSKLYDFFTDFFEPTKKERDEYNHQPFFWMEERDKSEEVNTNTRITALLFAAELWEDKQNHKYARK